MALASSEAPRANGSRERRIVAVVLPELLHELALQRSLRAAASDAPAQDRAIQDRAATRAAARPQQLELLASTAADPRAPRAPSLSHGSPLKTPPRARPRRERMAPRAVVLSDAPRSMLEPTARLDAVNAAARRAGVSTRHSIAQATAIVENLQICPLPPACVSRALQQVAEAALAFGAPVSFRAPDTVWVEISGTSPLFGGEHELALALRAHVQALGHAARVAVAPGPWLAQSFARHADFDETGVQCVAAADAEARSGSLPIRALPLDDDTVAWCARLGLLVLDDLRKLPITALAARIEARGLERTLDLIRGRDDGVLDAHQPEELPSEEQSWDFPLENVEPLLFVSKGLSARLGSRLEGRGQAARELLLTVQYDKAIVALRRREGLRPPPERSSPGERRPLDRAGADARPHDCLQIPFRLASPLAHAEDLERIVRSRLQRETLFAPACGLRLEVTAITEARQWQQCLNVEGGLRATLSSDPRTMAVLVAELSADIGDDAVGRLEVRDSHLLEKSSQFVPIQRLAAAGRSHGARRHRRSGGASPDTGASPGEAFARVPTRLFSPLEFNAPLKEKEIVVLERRAFVIESIWFEERLEAVEWWAPSPVSRDYYRVWLSVTSNTASAHAAAPLYSPPLRSPPLYSPALRSPAPYPPALTSPSPHSPSSCAPGSPALRSTAFGASARAGVEVLVYLDRDDGKKYVQALYD